jgi:hypothetical protein
MPLICWYLLHPWLIIACACSTVPSAASTVPSTPLLVSPGLWTCVWAVYCRRWWHCRPMPCVAGEPNAFHWLCEWLHSVTMLNTTICLVFQIQPESKATHAACNNLTCTSLYLLSVVCLLGKFFDLCLMHFMNTMCSCLSVWLPVCVCLIACLTLYVLVNHSTHIHVHIRHITQHSSTHSPIHAPLCPPTVTPNCKLFVIAWRSVPHCIMFACACKLHIAFFVKLQCALKLHSRYIMLCAYLWSVHILDV